MELIKLTNGERIVEVPKNVGNYLLTQGWTITQ
jgi:hypothetical protein